jgi:hypothetical protein
MTDAVKWEDALKITEEKNVEDALHAFKDSPSEDNAVGLAQYIIEAFMQQQRDRVTIMLHDDLNEGGDLFDDVIELAQKRTENPALKRGREMWAALLADGRRFRILACGLMLAAKHDENHAETDELIAKIDKAVEEIIADDDVPDLALIRRVADQLFARGLLKEVEDEPSDEQAAG